MDGGKAEDGCSCSACDESNAFTSVIVPTWMIRYQGTPPVSAWRVWHLLPISVRSRVRRHDLVSACYKRLAMGASHAVFILMQINFRIIGLALRSPLLRPSSSSYPPRPKILTSGTSYLSTCMLLDELEHAIAECRAAFSNGGRIVTVLSIALDTPECLEDRFEDLGRACHASGITLKVWVIAVGHENLAMLEDKRFLGQYSFFDARRA